MPDPVFWSLGYLHQHGYSLSLHCERIGCGNSAELDWTDLIARFGPDYDFTDRRAEFLGHFVCSKCGGKELGLILLPPGK